MKEPTTERRYVLRKQVKPDPNQPRKEFDQTKLQALADTFGGKAEGILECLKVREEKDGFVLIDGERRWRAAGIAGLERVPIEVIAPADVLKTQYIFGTQRENLSALEEAACAGRMLAEKQKADPKFSVDALGKELGKSRAGMYELLALLKISEPVRKAMSEGKLDASKARLFARVAPDLHAKLLKEATEVDHWDGTTMSVRDLQREIEENYSRQLGKATFSTKKEFEAMAWAQGMPVKGEKGQLVKLPACEACPLRSGNIEGMEGNPNVCTRVVCFDAKTRRRVEEMLAEAKQSGRQIVKDTSGCVYPDRDTYTGTRYEEWGKLAKAAKVEPALVVQSDGKVAEVFTEEQQKQIRKHGGFSERSGSGNPDQKRYNAYKKKEKVWEQAAFAAFAAITKVLTLKTWPSKLWVLLADAVARDLREDGAAFVARQLGLSEKKIGCGEIIEAYLTSKERTDRDRQAFIISGLLCYYWNDGGYYSGKLGWTDEFQELAKLAGVNLTKELAAVEAAKVKKTKPLAKPAKKGGKRAKSR